MLSLEEAQQRLLAALPPPKAETMPLGEALGRILAGKVSAPLDLPAFDNSAMDGYAVRSANLAGASAEKPVALLVLGRVAAGEVFSGEVTSGACVRLFTGSPLPRGADAVAMQEDTRLDPARPGQVLFVDAVKPWESVRLRGEDVRCGTVIADAGIQLNIARLNLLAALGVAEVKTGKRPLVGLLALGSELREAGQPLAPGEIYESNRLALGALIAQAGGLPRAYPLIHDTPAATSAALQQALDENDLVVTTGGASVGELDFVKSAFAEIGGAVDFWRVALKPGKPFVFGRWREKFLFGLPGNPVSALVTFLLLVRPALLRWQGAAEVALPAHPAVLAGTLSNPGDRRHFVRVTVDTSGQVHSAGVQAAHMLASLAAANGLVDVPPKTVLAVGTTVTVLRWE